MNTIKNYENETEDKIQHNIKKTTLITTTDTLRQVDVHYEKHTT